jgi:hypothetical protein
MKTACVAIFGLILALVSAHASADDAPAGPPPPDDCQGRVCISKAYRPAVDSDGYMVAPSEIKHADPDVAKALGARIVFFFYDVFTTWDPPPGTQFCVPTGCIHVERRCDDTKCDYTYGSYRAELGANGPTGRQVVNPEYVHIVFRSQKALASAERNVFLAVGSRDNETMVSLFAINSSLTGSSRNR